MDSITFDTVCDNGRQEYGEMDSNVLRTKHENKPDFRIEDDGTVTLLAAHKEVEIEEFGVNVR